MEYKSQDKYKPRKMNAASRKLLNIFLKELYEIRKESKKYPKVTQKTLNRIISPRR